MPNQDLVIPVIDHVAPIGEKRAAWLVDIWGVMHNGVAPFEGAMTACQTFRDQGGIVLLLSNAPRPRQAVMDQLDRIGVPRASYDSILSSGDAAQMLIQDLGPVPVFHIGPTRDLTLYDGFQGERTSNENAAEAIVCTGLFDDETETPNDYTQLLTHFAGRELAMICANPDNRVDRGGKLVYCAGALAQAYQRMGGTVHYAGKPYSPIYVQAMGLLSERAQRPLKPSDVLAIGDGVHTDIEGAGRAGIDAVFVASRVHIDGDKLNARILSDVFGNASVTPPIAAMSGLVW